MNPSTSGPDDGVVVPLRRPGRPRDARVDRAIVDAALDLAAEGGLDAVTVDGVAARAGVSKATLYRRWKTKEAMLLDAWLVLAEERDDELPDTGSLEGDLVVLVRRASEEFGDRRVTACMPDLLAAARVHADLRPAADRLLAEKSAHVLAAVERGIARGELPAGTDPAFVRDLLFGPTMFWVFRARPFTSQDMEQVMRVVVAGLKSLGTPVSGGEDAAHASQRPPDRPRS